MRLLDAPRILCDDKSKSIIPIRGLGAWSIRKLHEGAKLDSWMVVVLDQCVRTQELTDVVAPRIADLANVCQELGMVSTILIF